VWSTGNHTRHQPPRQLLAADAVGHDHVGEHEADVVAVLLPDLQRLDAVAGFEDGVAGSQCKQGEDDPEHCTQAAIHRLVSH